MKLLFCWLEYPSEYRGFSVPICLNFSRKEHFSLLRPSEQIRVSDRETPIPDGFWDAESIILNTTFFVGDNGAGKTTILQDLSRTLYAAIRQLPLKEVNTKLHQAFLLFSYEEQQEAYYAVWLDMDTCRWHAAERTADQKHICLNRKEVPETLSQNNLLYLTNLFDEADRNLLKDTKQNSVQNYALTNLLFIRQPVGENADPLTEFKKMEYLREVSFASDQALRSRMNQKNFPIRIPDALTVKVVEANIPSYGETLFSSLLIPDTFQNPLFAKRLFQLSFIAAVQYFTSALASQQAEDITAYIGELEEGKLEKDRREKLEQNIKTLVEQYVKEKVSRGQQLDGEPGKVLENLLRSTMQQVFNQLPNLLNGVLDSTADAMDFSNELRDVVLAQEVITYAKENLVDTLLSKSLWEWLSMQPAPEDTLLFNLKEASFADKSMEIIHKLTECAYLLEQIKLHSLEFHWGMSTGEENLLRTLSGLYHYAQHEIDDTPKTLFLFWDEADAGFHPDWQRQMIANFCNAVSEIFRGRNMRVQIFATTHSPLMLSDVPSDNVVYIQKGKGQLIVRQGGLQTFGQNLYNILKDGFFLREGTIGPMAKESIDMVLAYEELIFRYIKKKPANKLFKKEFAAKFRISSADMPKSFALFLNSECRKKLEQELNWRIDLFDGIYRNELIRRMQKIEAAIDEILSRENKIRALKEKIENMQNMLKELEAGGGEL